MSRPNKFNPGQYTQAGRLTPDDAAREMAKQRQLHTGSPSTGRHPWSPPPSALPAPDRRHESETLPSSENREPASAGTRHAPPDRLALLAGLVAGAFALGVAGLTLARRTRRNSRTAGWR